MPHQDFTEAQQAGSRKDLSAPLPCEKHSVKKFEKRVSYSAFGDSYSLLRRARDVKAISPSRGCPAAGRSRPDGWTGGLGGQVAGVERGPLSSTMSPRGEVPVVWGEQGVCKVDRGAAQDEWVWGCCEQSTWRETGWKERGGRAQPQKFIPGSPRLLPELWKRRNICWQSSFPDHPLGIRKATVLKA